jgi:phospholipase C
VAEPLLIINYDESGDFFDHVPPPTAPSLRTKQFGVPSGGHSQLALERSPRWLRGLAALAEGCIPRKPAHQISDLDTGIGRMSVGDGLSCTLDVPESLDPRR